MKSPKRLVIKYKREAAVAFSNRGFTLLEVIITVGILGILATMSLLYTFDAYRSNIFRSELGVMTNLLQKARNQAVNNIDELAHGVYFDSDKYVLFKGNTYSPTDPENQEVLRNATVVVSPDPVDPIPNPVIFEQLTGEVAGLTGEAYILVSYGGKSQQVEINHEGRINW